MFDTWAPIFPLPLEDASNMFDNVQQCSTAFDNDRQFSTLFDHSYQCSTILDNVQHFTPTLCAPQEIHSDMFGCFRQCSTLDSYPNILEHCRGEVYRVGVWRLRAFLVWRLASIGNIYWRLASTKLRASASTGLFAMASSVHRKYLSASRV